MLVVKSFCAAVVVVIFLFLYFRDYIHTMECLLSACAQVVFILFHFTYLTLPSSHFVVAFLFFDKCAVRLY